MRKLADLVSMAESGISDLRNINRPLLVQVPKGSSPSWLSLNLRVIGASIETWFDFRLRMSDKWYGALYPPPWHKTMGEVSDKLFKVAQYWMIVLPILVGITATLPVVIRVPGFEVSFGGNLSFTNSFRASFISGALLIFASIVRYLFLPSFVSLYPRSFVELPVDLTKAQLDASYKRFCNSCLPPKVKIGEVVIRRRFYGSYDSDYVNVLTRQDGTTWEFPVADSLGVFAYLMWRCSSSKQWKAFLECNEHFVYQSNWRASKEGESVFPESLLEQVSSDGISIMDVQEVGLHELTQQIVFPKQTLNIFMMTYGCSRLKDGKEIGCYESLYDFWDNSNNSARALFWFLYISGISVGVYVAIGFAVSGARALFG